MQIDTVAAAKDGLGIAVGLLLMGFTVYNYAWRLLIETNPAWGPISGSGGVHLFNLAVFVGGVLIAYLSFLNGIARESTCA
ncbi:hypothetical protein [Haladaptatus sp. CMAA 1911]|uniref:hypothetical protein n=1 Tax=unclassified Haladaptatus TaxID=2622732 RepID=UPI003754BF5F